MQWEKNYRHMRLNVCVFCLLTSLAVFHDVAEIVHCFRYFVTLHFIDLYVLIHSECLGTSVL